MASTEHHPVSPVPSNYSNTHSNNHSPHSYQSSNATSPRPSPASPYSPSYDHDKQSYEEEEEEEVENLDTTLYKRDVDVRREQGAHYKAEKLLNTVVAGEKYKEVPKSAYEIRQEAIHKYEAKKSGKPQVELPEKELATPTLATIKMAETTRKPRALTEDDVRDPESISGMKCKLDWEREEWAKKKALKLLLDEKPTGLL